MSGGCGQEIRFGQSPQDAIVISPDFHGGILFLSVGFLELFSGVLRSFLGFGVVLESRK
jgi:hypothetical protein